VHDARDANYVNYVYNIVYTYFCVVLT